MEKYHDYNPDTERAVLAACLAQPHLFGNMYGLLSPDCFYQPQHRQVFDTMCNLWHDGVLTDVNSVSGRFYAQNLLLIDNYNTGYYLSQLQKDGFMPLDVRNACTELKALAARRMMIELTSGGLKGDVMATAQHLQQSLQKILQLHTPNTWIDASQAAMQLSNHIEELKQGVQMGISTGFAQLDAKNGGFRPGQLVVIGARPSVGKSALAGGIALAAAKQNHHVGIISLEMPARDLLGRMVSLHSGIPFAAIDRQPDATNDEKLAAYIGDIAALPLHFSDNPQATVYDIRSLAEQLKSSKGIDILIVDYLQLIEEPRHTQQRNREQNISAISRGLKQLAMTLDIPVIALSQLNRESEHRADKRPSMADLRESGSIEQDADVVMLLHRDHRAGFKEDINGHDTTNQADLFVVKWRNGETLDLKLRFDGGIMKFSEW